jgi:uncharacterized membrane protein
MLVARETQTMRRCPASPDTPRGARIAVLLLGMVLAWPEPALAYVGPGAGISLLGALWAVIAAVVFALAGLIWWPIRMMRRRRKQAADAAATAGGEHAQSD